MPGSEVDGAGESRGAEGEGDEDSEMHVWFAGSWLDVFLVKRLGSKFGSKFDLDAEHKLERGEVEGFICLAFGPPDWQKVE